MSFDGLVVGGISSPTFYLIGSNLITNPYFNIDTTGWSESSGGILTRVADDNAYGEYVGRLQYSADFQNVYFDVTLDEAPYNRTWLLHFRAKSQVGGNNIIVHLYDEGGQVFLNSTIEVPADWKTFSIVVLDDSSTIVGPPYSISLRIYGDENSPANADLLFDHVYLTEVTNTITLPATLVQGGEPDSLIFEKIIRGKNELWSGEIQEFGKKYRPNYIGNYDYLSADNEVLRQKLSDGQKIFVKPHSDIDWGFMGIWKEDFKRGYTFGRYIGHKGTINIQGVEFLYSIPQIITNTDIGIEII